MRLRLGKSTRGNKNNLTHNDMEKVKIAFSKALAWLNKAYQWLNKEGGMLHILACYAMMLALSPIIGWWAILPTTIIAAAKEGWDYFIQKDNDKPQVIHDLICDGAGIIIAYITMTIWWILTL